ncbi:hypothetical protein CYG48_09775 [Neorhizobium sp. SOG26]|nr:hypothetical protein CYG48_09775 [Neorhizobium sp. SOG26]
MIDRCYPPLPCRASPPQGGRSPSCAGPFASRRRARGSCGGDWVGTVQRSISPLEGEMPGRAEGGV